MRTKITFKHVKPEEDVEVMPHFVKPSKQATKTKPKQKRKKTEAQLKAERVEAVALWDRAFERDGGWKAVGMVDPSTECQKQRKFRWATDEQDPSTRDDALKSELVSPPRKGLLWATNVEAEGGAVLGTLQPRDINANENTSYQGGDFMINILSLAGGNKENPILTRESPEDEKGGACSPKSKRKADGPQADATGRVRAKAACTAVTISEKNRGHTKCANIHALPVSCVRETGSGDSKKSSHGAQPQGPPRGASGSLIQIGLPQAAVREFTEDDFQGYALKQARRSELEKSKFAILLSRAESLVKCAVCKSEEEDDDDDDDESDGQLTVILAPHYPFHPRAWNDHIQSEGHSRAVICHRHEELRKVSKNFSVIDGSRLRCIACTGDWRRDKKAATFDSYEGIVILDPHYPLHPRAWEEHIGTWTHIDNEVAMNKVDIGIY